MHPTTERGSLLSFFTLPTVYILDAAGSLAGYLASWLNDTITAAAAAWDPDTITAAAAALDPNPPKWY